MASPDKLRDRVSLMESLFRSLDAGLAGLEGLDAGLGTEAGGERERPSGSWGRSNGCQGSWKTFGTEAGLSRRRAAIIWKR